MTPNRQRILAGVGALAVAAGALAFLVWGNLEENVVYYWSPSELVEHGDKALEATVRLGGLVVPASVDWKPETQQLAFQITDGSQTIPVQCTGAPPQMFREGIGVVVEGQMQLDGIFRTDRVMVKHSNEYRAPEDGQMPAMPYTLVEDS